MKHKELVFQTLYKKVTYVPRADEFGGAVQKLIRIAEDLRDRNKDGYLDSSHRGGFLANIKQWDFGPYLTTATTCSPFTGTLLGVLFDPDPYPKDDLKKDPYVPMYNDGKDKLPKTFWWAHNRDNQPIESIVDYGLGIEVPMTEMRRGDLLGINWGGHGHAVFCWDVHLNGDGKVDAFTMLGSHGGKTGMPYYGISIYGCEKMQLEGSLATGFPGTGSLHKATKYNGKIFVDLDEFVENSVWFGLPGVKVPVPKKPDPAAIDFSTFRVTPKKFSPSEGASYWPQVKDVHVARLNYKDKLIDPYCMKDGAGSPKPSGSSPPAPAPTPAKPAETPKPPPVGHADAPIVVVSKPALKKDPDAIKKVPPKPVVQEKAKPTQWQLEVEHAMQVFFQTKWIDKDPGSSSDINDAKTQEAIKAFQTLFHLKPDGDPGPKTRPMIAKQLPACLQQHDSEKMLAKLFAGGKIKSDPGQADGVNDAKTRAAVGEFQDGAGLEPNGVPDAETIVKLKEALEHHEASDDQHGLDPRFVALYWLGNGSSAGGSATLRLHSADLKRGQEVRVFLKSPDKDDEVETTKKLVAKGDQSELAVSLPEAFGIGAQVLARVTAEIAGRTLELKSTAPLYVRPAAPGSALEEFFRLSGELGEKEAPVPHTYVAYKVAGKPGAWFLMGRLMMDVDGAPNCYHPNDYQVNTHYWEYDIMAHKGALDWKRNGGHGATEDKPANWFGVVTDSGKSSGNPIVQGPKDPFPGFYVSSTSLVDRTKQRTDPRRYVDARQIPYVAFNYQVYVESGQRFERKSQGATGRFGDILTVVNPKADDEHKYVHAIFADCGGLDSPHFGEGSPAMGLRIKAYGRVNADILYICYPHSGADQGTIPTFDEIQTKGEKLFKEWGGMDEANRVLKAMPK